MNHRKQKTLEETMKTTVILTPNSSVKSSLTVDSFYYPGCKKNANCKCEICIASINATLDLMPHSTHRSSFSKIPISRPRSPVSFNPDPSTPKSSARSSAVTVIPPTERINFQEKVETRKEDWGFRFCGVKLFWGLILVFGVDYGISWMISGALQPRLSAEVVKNLGLKSRDFESLNRRFLFLKNELEDLVGKDVLCCSCGDDSLWKINQDGMLLNSRCVLYKSMIEEVSIWGWPLQTAGLLAADYSSRSFTVISGRVTEWSDKDTSYLVRLDDNSSWCQGKWTASIVHFDQNTWILEYRRSFLVDNAKLVSAAMEFLKFRLGREFGKMKREFWMGPTSGIRRFENARGSTTPPT